MNKLQIYTNDWLKIHPYTAVQPSDSYFVNLSNKLYGACTLTTLPDLFRKKLSMYIAAYLEDQISELGLWQSFTAEHKRLYGKYLPFYPTNSNYVADEINEEDIRFIIWNTWQKAASLHEKTYINPNEHAIEEQAGIFYGILEEAYENAPENESLNHYFDHPGTAVEADRKLTWLFGDNYLTEPSMLPYIEQIAPNDRFIVPVGPLALFLHEWISLLTTSDAWKQINGLFTGNPEIPQEIQDKNREIYRNFIEGTNGKRIVYLNGYTELRRFLVNVLKWQDDDNHTLPQMKEYKNFILMTEPEKGVLLAKDICEYIADRENPLYDSEKAQANAFRMLTEEMLCPPDLLIHCINNKLIPDAQLPDGTEKELVQQNADFIARHSLLYYYRGD